MAKRTSGGKTIFGARRATKAGGVGGWPFVSLPGPQTLCSPRIRPKQTALVLPTARSPALSMTPPGKGTPRGWGGARAPQDSWLTRPLWDSGLGPGIQEAVILEL